MEMRRQLVGVSEAIREIQLEIECAGRTDAKTLITGESGVGKEVVANLIHHESRRRFAPFVAINCAGIPDSLLESELFGHVRGSFTDAHRDKKGWLDHAQGGTVFLDEIGEMSSRMQAVLLRFLESGEIQRVGRRSSACDRGGTNHRRHQPRPDRAHHREAVSRGSVLSHERDPHRDSAFARAQGGRSATARPISCALASETHKIPAPAHSRRDHRASG